MTSYEKILKHLESNSPTRVTLPTIKRDLKWIAGRHDWTQDNAACPEEVTVHCAACGTEIDYDLDYVDKDLSKFRCPKDDGGYLAVLNTGCGKEWGVKAVEKMTNRELGAQMYTALRVTDEPIYKFVTKSNGVTRYTGTEEMNSDEKVPYYQKALHALREKP